MLIAGAYFFFLMTSYFILRPIRDTMAVAAGVANMPYMFLGTFIATLIAQPLFAWLVVRYPVKKFIGITYQIFAINLVMFYVATRMDANEIWMGRLFYWWASLFAFFAPSLFWCFMADAFRSGQAKRLFGFIGVGGTLGSLTGSALTAVLARSLGPVNLLLVSAALLEIAIVIVFLFPAREARLAIDDTEPDEIDQNKIGGSMWAGFTHVVRSPYLAGVAFFLVLYSLGSTVLYSQQAEIIGRAYTERADRTQVLAQIEFAAQLLTVITQFFLTGRIIKWIGMPATLALTPLLSMIGFAALGASALGATPLLATYVVFIVLRRSCNFSLTNPAMEALFTVVPREDKYKAKSFIETFVYRLADQIGVWAYAGLAAAGFALTGIAWISVPVAGLFLAVGVWLGRRHGVLSAQLERRPTSA